MKILVVSATPWNTNNSFGNSYTNIFSGMEDCKFANIYCSDGVDNVPLVSHAFRITEKNLLLNILGKVKYTGEEVPVQEIIGTGETKTPKEKKILSFAKKHRWQIMFWCKEAIWKIGKWDTPQLHEFIKMYQPDLVWVPIYKDVYMSRIDEAVAEIANVPVFGYISDDNYTLRHFSPSIFYWIDRLYARRIVKKTIDQCSVLYVISNIQKKEYDKIFHKDCHILTKGADFSVERPEYKVGQFPLQMFYAGNIGANRWRSLAVICKKLKSLNKDTTKAFLTIYTATPITKKMEKELNIEGSSYIAGCIPYKEVVQKQQCADILVHVEPTDIIQRWESHQGFSTKLVDYMASGRPILAYGIDDQASIAHLKKHDAAIVATTEQELETNLKKIVECPLILEEYAQKAWECGKQNHDIRCFQNMLKADFRRVMNENSAD